MIKIKIGNKIILIDLFEIDLRNWMRISKYVIDKYGFKQWLEYTYYVKYKDELEEMEYEEAIKFLMNH